MGARIEFLPADVLGPGPLVRAALAGKLAPGVVRSTAELAPPARVRDPLALEERAELAARLEAGATALEPPIAVLEGLRKLADPGASLVLAQRPVGLLAGPLATLHAGAAAVALARELERRWERPVVAGLWLDDTVAERPEAWVLGRNHDLVRLSLDGLEGEVWPAQVPLTRTDHGLGALEAVLAQLYGDHPALGEALAALVPREGETLTRAAARALAALLGPAGLVPLDPAWLRVDLAGGLARLAARGRAPGPEEAPQPRPGQAGGGAAPLDPEDVSAAPVALFRGPRGLEPQFPGGEGFQSPGRPGARTPAELAAAVLQDPRSWAAGPRWIGAVLELVLPVGVHLVEPRALALDLSRPALLAELGQGARPAALRGAVTLVEPEVRVSLERAGIDALAAVRAAAGSREPQVDPKGIPTGQQVAAERLRAAAAEARRGILGSKGELAALDAGLAGQLARIARGLEGELERLARRVERARANQLGQDRRRARRIENSLAPLGTAQEQVLAPFAALARHGPGWLGSLVELEPLGSEHVLVQLELPPERAPRAGP